MAIVTSEKDVRKEDNNEEEEAGGGGGDNEVSPLEAKQEKEGNIVFINVQQVTQEEEKEKQQEEGRGDLVIRPNMDTIEEEEDLVVTMTEEQVKEEDEVENEKEEESNQEVRPNEQAIKEEEQYMVVVQSEEHVTKEEEEEQKGDKELYPSEGKEEEIEEIIILTNVEQVTEDDEVQDEEKEEGNGGRELRPNEEAIQEKEDDIVVVMATDQVKQEEEEGNVDAHEDEDQPIPINETLDRDDEDENQKQLGEEHVEEGLARETIVGIDSRQVATINYVEQDSFPPLESRSRGIVREKCDCPVSLSYITALKKGSPSGVLQSNHSHVLLPKPPNKSTSFLPVHRRPAKSPAQFPHSHSRIDSRHEVYPHGGHIIKPIPLIMSDNNNSTGRRRRRRNANIQLFENDLVEEVDAEVNQISDVFGIMTHGPDPREEQDEEKSFQQNTKTKKNKNHRSNPRKNNKSRKGKNNNSKNNDKLFREPTPKKCVTILKSNNCCWISSQMIVVICFLFCICFLLTIYILR